MKTFILLCILLVLPLCFGNFQPLFSNLKFNQIKGIEVASGSHIEYELDQIKITHQNGTVTYHSTHRSSESKMPQVVTKDVPKQWLAWYFKGSLGTSMGFTLFNSTWQVPNMPSTDSNIAIFNGLQAAPDDQDWNWILQPIVAIGDWMLGDYSTWITSSVVCTTTDCLWTTPVATKPGHTILGTITLVQKGPPYKFSIQITDLTAKTPTQTLTYSSQYFAPWAYVSLEHNPAGSIKSCSELPQSSQIIFQGNDLQPYSPDVWEGAQNDLSCGLSVDYFVYDDTQLVITI